MQKQSKGLGIGALICGLASFVLLFVTIPTMCGAAKANSLEGTVGSMIALPAAGLITGILGIILGAIGIKKQSGKGLAIAGMVCGIVGTVVCGIITICNGALFA